ncbi:MULTISPECIES: hypothetical protein [unclassified Sphingomonas]|uniref:hypothetical protein n=1 Tax=unclassified Sphingomonas TaxID=196159 RepID=UPI000BDD3B97|nr:MAG: hypothetical protein B7Z43_03845 [Sphingomonas sp. 12-62-6]OYX38852.1 MAG: hypothetical protein B7Y98_06945 [Sphingomonas sp. 32-62-10]
MIPPKIQPANQRPKLQKVDALSLLKMDDPAINRDAKVLEILKVNVRRNMKRPSLRGPLKIKPSLYKRYRGNGFPIRSVKGRQLPKWRSISPWLKVQMAQLVLGETGFMPFRVHFDQSVLDHLNQIGKDPKDYLRDKISRQLSMRFGGTVPMFFFVMEDRDKNGATVAPHAHGAIEALWAPLPTLQNGKVAVALRRVAAKKGTRVAELVWGKRLIRQALRAASGPIGNNINSKSISAASRVWLHDPRLKVFNTQYVDYMFKNAAKFSSTLRMRRLAIRSELTAEATLLWRLVTQGESIMLLLI